MGFIFDSAEVNTQAQEWLAAKNDARPPNGKWNPRLPFAMDPVVYDFEINDNRGHRGAPNAGSSMTRRRCPSEYYAMMVPKLSG